MGRIQVKGKCGVQLQSSTLPKNIKAKEALYFFAKWQKTKINEDLVKRLGVMPFWKKQYVGLSAGQKRRLHLAITLLGSPDIILLDEPTAGLDVEGRVTIHNEIRKLKRQGKTIVLASHDMAEVEELSDRTAILSSGKIAFLGTPVELVENRQSNFTIKIRFGDYMDTQKMNISPKPLETQGYYLFQTESIETTLSTIIRYVGEQGVCIHDVKVEQADIEQQFLEIAKGDMK